MPSLLRYSMHYPPESDGMGRMKRRTRVVCGVIVLKGSLCRVRIMGKNAVVHFVRAGGCFCGKDNGKYGSVGKMTDFGTRMMTGLPVCEWW